MPVTVQVLHAPTAAGHWDRCFVLLLTRQSILQKYDSPFFTEFIITQDGRHRRRGAASLGKDKCQVGAISWRDAATHFLDTTQSRLCIFLHINTHNYNGELSGLVRIEGSTHPRSSSSSSCRQQARLVALCLRCVVGLSRPMCTTLIYGMLAINYGQLMIAPHSLAKF